MVEMKCRECGTDISPHDSVYDGKCSDCRQKVITRKYKKYDSEGDRDWFCRNCETRFVPNYWIGGWHGQLVGQCPVCGSNATHELFKKDE